MVPLRDPEAAARAVERLMADPALRRRLATRAGRRQGQTWRATALQTLEVYERDTEPRR